jgi:hypothetical protein
MRQRRAITILEGVCGLACVFGAGCIPIGYAYPAAAFVPGVQVRAPAEEVHAFRLDVADDQNCVDFAGREHDRYVLRPLALGRGDRLGPQVKVAIDYGWIWNCIALSYGGHTQHTLLVRLYRPGFRTIEVRSWQKDGEAKWIEATDLESREKAVDDLLSTWNTDFQRSLGRAALTSGDVPRDSAVFRSLAAGAASKGHRQALLFAASEYERLKSAADPAMRSRLEEKTQTLRRLAG